jgi:ABC-type sugar transport system ATPase subunit
VIADRITILRDGQNVATLDSRTAEVERNYSVDDRGEPDNRTLPGRFDQKRDPFFSPSPSQQTLSGAA